MNVSMIDELKTRRKVGNIKNYVAILVVFAVTSRLPSETRCQTRFDLLDRIREDVSVLIN